MSTATSQPKAATTIVTAVEPAALRRTGRTVVASGWYDPDGAAWEPEIPFESPIATTSTSRPSIEVEGSSERRRS